MCDLPIIDFPSSDNACPSFMNHADYAIHPFRPLKSIHHSGATITHPPAVAHLIPSPSSSSSPPTTTNNANTTDNTTLMTLHTALHLLDDDVYTMQSYNQLKQSGRLHRMNPNTWEEQDVVKDINEIQARLEADHRRSMVMLRRQQEDEMMTWRGRKKVKGGVAGQGDARGGGGGGGGGGGRQGKKVMGMGWKKKDGCGGGGGGGGIWIEKIKGRVCLIRKRQRSDISRSR